MKTSNHNQIQSQANKLNCWNSPNKLAYNQLNHIQHNSSQGSFSSSSDQSINQLNHLTSDYSFNSSANSSKNSSTLSNMLDSNVQLVNQITMTNAMTNAITFPNQQSANLPSNDQEYLIDSTKSSDNQIAIVKNQNSSKFFNDIPTPGLDKNRIKKKGKQSAYKHVPHREKPPHVVAKRNARERKRVQQVNDAFTKLRKTVPIENKNKRVSKVKTLQKAIDYIKQLRDLIDLPNSSDACLNFEFKFDDEDSENSEAFFGSEFFDDMSQKSTKVNDEINLQAIQQQKDLDLHANQQKTIDLQAISIQQNVIDLQSPDSNNNLLNSTINNLSINNFNNDNQVNYQPNRNQQPIQNQLNKENILYQSITSNCNPIYNASYPIYGSN